ncbi:hypothetical protein AVEN_245488-1 [Araneus ventricosus]|uniref:Uncharacterized protein n=1 Tax=Araneus ventricosus TaxID=182803 RepID=A0A4Y2D5V8_ARAVE|nr:hypothetical protein AVEN_245488-1 [Araneus ventricosus]
MERDLGIRCTSSEVDNRYPLSKFFNRGTHHMERDLGNSLVVEVPKYEVLTYNLIAGGICEPAHFVLGTNNLAFQRYISCVSPTQAGV